MLQLNRKGLKDKKNWERVGIALPAFDVEEMARETERAPEWVHFGAGNIFRIFPAMLQQKLLNAGRAKRGIIAVKTYDWRTIETMYLPFDNLTLGVIMEPDGSLDMTVVASISKTLAGDPAAGEDWARLRKIFAAPSLKIASFTITEKGYNLDGPAGTPENPTHVMAKACSLVYDRFIAGGAPLALVSMDNCAKNGDRLRESIVEVAKGWTAAGLVDEAFVPWLMDKTKVSYPLTMIDKITPEPSERVRERLEALGLGTGETLRTKKHSAIAPFVNAERAEYLVVEDWFPNGRPPLELAGAHFTDRKTVERVEKMKVGACLNPLHTALAIFGCLLGYALIADEMKDPDLKKLVEGLGYDEGLPVVEDPGIISPEVFLREVLEERLPNPNIPDTPQRIATDTSQKMGVRFGGTIKAYMERKDRGTQDLRFIPLVIAAWCRYLLGVDDRGVPMTLSPDPLLDSLASHLLGITLGEASGGEAQLRPILTKEGIFPVDLYEAGLGEKIEGLFEDMTRGPGAVRETLRKFTRQIPNS